MQGHFTNAVRKFCKARLHRNIFSIRGSTNSAAAYIQKPKKGNLEQTYEFEIWVETGKSWLMNRLKSEKPDPACRDAGLIKMLKFTRDMLKYSCYCPYTGNRKGVCCMNLSSFILSVLAGVVAYYICKWLDGEE